MKLFLSRALTIALLLLCGLIAVATMTPVDPRTRADRISDACKKEFSDLGKGAVLECTVTVLNHWASDMERERMDRVYESVY